MKRYKNYGFMREHKNGEWIKVKDIVSLLYPLVYTQNDTIPTKALRDLLQAEIHGSSIRAIIECMSRKSDDQIDNRYLPLKDVHIPKIDNNNNCCEFSPTGRSRCFLARNHIGRHRGTLILRTGDVVSISWRKENETINHKRTSEFS
jgi:hypothetical protein